MKSLKPGLVGTGGTGIGSSPPLPPEEGLIGVVLITETRTRFGESWQKITGGGPGGSRSAIAERSRAAAEGVRREGKEGAPPRHGPAVCARVPEWAAQLHGGPAAVATCRRPGLPQPLITEDGGSLCLGGLPAAPLRLRGHPRADPPSQRRPPAMAAAGAKQSQRPRTFPKRSRPRWQPWSRRCPRRSRRCRLRSSALAARAEPQVFPRYVSRPSAANHPAGASVTGSLFPPANRWAGKAAAAPLRAGPEGEAVHLLPFYWAEAGPTTPEDALIGPPRRGRGEAGVARPGRFGALRLWAGCAGQSRGGAAELARPAA